MIDDKIKHIFCEHFRGSDGHSPDEDVLDIAPQAIKKIIKDSLPEMKEYTKTDDEMWTANTDGWNEYFDEIHRRLNSQ